MTRPIIQPTPTVPLLRSGIYEFPLRPTEAQARWLQTRYPTNHQIQYFHFALDGVQIRQRLWNESMLFSPVFPSALAVELSGLTECALEALARYTPGEVVPAGWAQDAPLRAWLCPESVGIVARPDGEYKVEFAFRSQRPLFHFGRAVERALAFQVDAEVEAERLADELQYVRNELDRVQQRLANCEAQMGDTPSPTSSATIRPRASSRRIIR